MDQPCANIANLHRRSQLLREVRQFFYDRQFVEVETPLLCDEIIPELHIDPIANIDRAQDAPRSYLQASPELQMKLLLSAGMTALFQITKSFRGNEQGPLHHPEFTIVEWYRISDNMRSGMKLLDELCQATLQTSAASRTSYATAFETYADINPHTASLQQLAACAQSHQLTTPTGMDVNSRDQWLNVLLALQVEPQLGREGPEILYDYPASQAALAKTVLRDSDFEVAERFELYWQGVELANGYHELTDASELRRRFEQVNADRCADNRDALPMPESLLQAMHQGLPSCAGCALGFDRLVMLACGANSIHEVMAPGKC